MRQLPCLAGVEDAVVRQALPVSVFCCVAVQLNNKSAFFYGPTGAESGMMTPASDAARFVGGSAVDLEGLK